MPQSAFIELFNGRVEPSILVSSALLSIMSRRGRRGVTGASSPALSSPTLLSGDTPAVTPADGHQTSPVHAAPSVTAAAATTTTTATVRRFGGPYYPIADIDSMPSNVKCMVLQQNLHQILQAWRSAKQMLKELDQRTAASSSGGGAGGRGSSSRSRGGGRGQKRAPSANPEDPPAAPSPQAPFTPTPPTTSTSN
uniref:ARID domain-containing protein n=1 Tax=Mesocestoides corti TaxID=53468 RepID=A0A5K3F3V9_MESCO